jgi:hypothetical protein
VPRGAVPTVDELEARIDEALAIALASEDGVHEVGEMALDAARQARRAAEAAEGSARAAAAIGTAARAALTAARPAAAQSPEPAGPVSDETPPPGPPREVVIDPVQRFNERADAIAARLQKLVSAPL